MKSKRFDCKGKKKKKKEKKKEEKRKEKKRKKKKRKKEKKKEITYFISWQEGVREKKRP